AVPSCWTASTWWACSTTTRTWVATPVIAGRFHNAVAAAIVTVCAQLRAQTGLGVVALSGGVFQNLLLTGRVVRALADSGFRVRQHSRVPCNDGGLSLGQAAVAGSRCHAAGSSSAACERSTSASNSTASATFSEPRKAE